jgi:ferredoxin
VLKGRVWVALHMHAGDGNVHTNIPVNSDDYEMLQTAHEAVARIMALARSLDGVISGEHGIGITKLEFLTDEEIAALRRLQAEGRPGRPLQQGQAAAALAPGQTGTMSVYADLTNAYTPSFGLMGHESLIMQQSDIGAIADSIKDCLRCGKCKPVCATHVPRANLLYSPRNKILATSLLVEAFLYEEQTRRGVSHQALGGVRGRLRPLHGVPQVPEPLPGEHRLRRRLDEHAQPAAQDGAEELPARQRGRDVHAERDQARRPSSSCAARWSTWASRPSAWPTTCCAASRASRTLPPATVARRP